MKNAGGGLHGPERPFDASFYAGGRGPDHAVNTNANIAGTSAFAKSADASPATDACQRNRDRNMGSLALKGEQAGR
jgi:hypothetical protein